MAEAVVGAVIGATLQVVIQNLVSVSTKDIKLIRDFTDDLEKLKSTLTMIQTFLYDAEMQQVTDKSVKQWLKRLEDVAFEADNVLDEFNYELMRRNTQKMETKSTVKKKIKSIFSTPKFRDRRLKLGHKIRDINEELDLVNREASCFGLQMRLVGIHAPRVVASASSETDSFTVDPVFLESDDDVSRIAEMLICIPTEQVFSVLPIVGMGGLGKTTLARQVYHHEKIHTHFQTTIWVHVSAVFDPIILFKNMLIALFPEKVEIENREFVLKKIQEALTAKTFLLVLDDVWNQDVQMWEDFINPLSRICSTKGNGIIVTTRNSKVGSIVGTLPVYELGGLSEDSCLFIINAKAFGEGDTGLLDFQTIGRDIARRCQGLPLAANVVGGLLRGKSVDDWLSIKDNWLSDVEEHENNILKILKLSFDHLPSPSLKKCFAYCSIFSKGAPIDPKKLVELWMAEGLLQSSRTSDMENVGNKFLNLLLQHSLLQVVDRDKYNNVSRCSMHDLVHDVAISVFGFPKVKDNISDGVYQTRYISWQSNGDESSCIPKAQAKWWRTLFYQGEISDINFSHFKSLRTLTLVSYQVRELPDSVNELIHLRNLNLSYTRVRYLPDSIGKLYHLQTLRAMPTKLPSTLRCLLNLRHLHVPDYTELPPQLGMLTSLRTLPCFKARDEEGYRIVELESLTNLKGELKIDNLEKVQVEEESDKVYLIQKSGLVRLVLRWDDNREGRMNDETVLKVLQPHPNLKILEIFGFKGASFPSWTLKMAVSLEGHYSRLDNLMELRLSNCVECEEIPSLGHLPRLKFLYLSHLRNVKSIGSSFYGVDHGVCKEKIIAFPVLNRLRLLDMPNLTEWVEVEIPGASEPHDVKVFPHLEYLSIKNCKQLRSAPSQFPCLRELDISEMDSDLPLANICGFNLTSLTKLRIVELYKLVHLPHWLLHNNQNLSVLEIRNCPKLRELPHGLHALNSLEELSIEWCSNLESISLSSGLKVLNIGFVPELIITPPTEVDSLRSLQTLIISSNAWDPDSSGCVSFKIAVDGILRLGSKSIRTLDLTGMEDWYSFPRQLQHLTALTKLRLYNFGVEELPEWIGNLSSLQALVLYHCKKLRRLSSVEAMRRLTKLTYLHIIDCPLLKERCVEQQSDDHDSEWSKISHIPCVSIDRRSIRN